MVQKKNQAKSVQRQKTLFFNAELLKEYETICSKLGFRISSRMEQYMRQDLRLLQSYMKNLEII
jgi:hypothetical protein